MSEQWEYFHEVQSVHSELFPNVKAWESHFESVRDKTTGEMVVRIRDKRHAMLIAAAPELKDVALEGYELSRYAACSNIENTEEFLTGLMERIELYQYNCKRVIESATGLPIEEVLK